MRKGDGYEFEADEMGTMYHFKSIGPNGAILKVVKFTLIGKDYSNLAFGDVTEEGDFDDEVVSDNRDMRKIIQTIANIIHAFNGYYPSRKILIFPVDYKRKLLYNRIFQQLQNEVLLYFAIEGRILKPPAAEVFQPAKLYDAFILSPLDLTLNR